jgi:hypothetical protein
MTLPFKQWHSQPRQVTPDTVAGCVIGTGRNSYSYR